MIDQNREHRAGSPAGHRRACSSARSHVEAVLLLGHLGQLPVDDLVPRPPLACGFREPISASEKPTSRRKRMTPTSMTADGVAPPPRRPSRRSHQSELVVAQRQGRHAGALASSPIDRSLGVTDDSRCAGREALTSSVLEVVYSSHEHEAACSSTALSGSSTIRPDRAAPPLGDGQALVERPAQPHGRAPRRSVDRPRYELGCGPGVAIAASSSRAARGLVVGVDHSEVMIRQARRRNAAAISAGRIICARRRSPVP